MAEHELPEVTCGVERSQQLTIACLLATVFAVAAPASSVAAESTALLDVRMILENPSQSIYDEPLAFDMLHTQLPRIRNPQSQQQVDRWVRDFAKYGFQKNRAALRLFRSEHDKPRRPFLKIVQASQYKLTDDFLREVYQDYKNNPGTHDFGAFTEPAWIEFNRQTKDPPTYQALLTLLKSRAAPPNLMEYLPVLYFAYRVFDDEGTSLDNEVRKSHLDSPALTAQRIQQFYTGINGSSSTYWASTAETQGKRSWISRKLAWRLFSDFGPDDWSGLEHKNVLDMAGELVDVAQTTEYQKVPIEAWLLKMGQRIKAAPGEVGPRSLLSYFIANSALPLTDSFKALRPLFADDQAMFVVLHQSPPTPTPMQLWHQDAQVLSDCVGLLEGFFHPDRANEWDTPLFGCLRDDYYRPYDIPLKDRLFSGILKPISANEALAPNAVRRQILADTHAAGSYLLDSHRYEIAHHLLSTQPMTATIPMPGAAVEVLQFAVDVYNSLNVTDPELYRSRALQQEARKLGLDPNLGAADQILVYVNVVVGTPVLKMCHAFMGRETIGNVRFSLKDQVRVAQFESLLRSIVKWKGVLRANHGNHAAARARPKVLESVTGEIVDEMKAAIERKDKDQIVNMVRLTLKITVILEDDHYIEEMLAALRKDVFEVPTDPTQFRRLPSEELSEMVERFNVLHSEDLVDALRAVGKMKYVEMFYDQLYVPLRSIYGFFRLVKAEPYLLYLNEFATGRFDRPADVHGRWQREVESFGQIHGEEGAGDVRYINAEEAIADLLRAYCQQLKIALWQDPIELSLNRNVNLAVLYRLLFQVPLPVAGAGEPEELASTDWRLAGLTHDERSRCYREAAAVFLKHLADASLVDRSTRLDAGPEVYGPWDFFTLLHSLMELYEIHGFRFREYDPATLYDGDPRRGIQRSVLVGATNLLRDKVDGSLRDKIFGPYWQAIEAGDPVDHATLDKVVSLALLLPNHEENNANEPAVIAAYEQTKGKVFEYLAARLTTASEDDRRLRLLQWLCRLEASVYGLGNDSRGFGYEPLRGEASRTLPPSLMHDLTFEEFRLMHINQGMAAPGGESLSLVAMAQIVQQVVDALCRHYVFAESSQRYDRMSQFILDVVRAMRKEKVLERLQKDHLDEFYFLTTYCRNTILLARDREAGDLTEDEKKAVVAVASRLIFLHTYFAPYVDAEFDKEALYDLDYALPLFCMLQRDVKKPLVELLDLYESTYKEVGPLLWFEDTGGSAAREVPIMEPWELKTFLMCHNLLPLYLLEATLEDAKRFCRLVDGEEVSMTAYNFRILWERKDQARVSLESLCQEVFDGVDLNREILAGTRQLKDEDYLQYFFGDMRAVLDEQSRYSAEMPQNFDSVVRRFAVLPEDPRWENVKSGIEEGLRNLNDPDDADTRARYETALSDVKHIRKKVDAVFDKAYDFFGSVLVEKFRSPFTMQKACEQAGEKIAEASGTLRDQAYTSYSSFYRSGLLGTDGFREDIEEAMVERFYPDKPNTQPADQYLAEKRADYRALIDGREQADTQGFVAVARKRVGQRTEFEKDYLAAGQRLMKSLFCGRYVPAGRPFLGDLVWDIDKRGERQGKPLDYAGRADEIRDLVLWIRDNAERYTSVPELREVFVAPGSFPVPTAAKTEGGAP